MAYSHLDFDMALAAAAGDDLSLMAELHAGFVESFQSQLDLLQRARCDGNWQLAAQRIKGLGASFHIKELVKLADEAIDGAPGDPAIIRKMANFLTSFSAHH